MDEPVSLFALPPIKKWTSGGRMMKTCISKDDGHDRYAERKSDNHQSNQTLGFIKTRIMK
jgi:hypothetical protein